MTLDVPWCRFDVGNLVDDARLEEKLTPLIYEAFVADVISRLDVVGKSGSNVVDGLADRLRPDF